MPKQSNKTGVFVRVDPGLWSQLGSGKNDEINARFEKRAQSQCQDIMDEIRRHVDNVESVHMEWETEDVCSHCGDYWLEKSDQYNGGCCDEDENNNPENQKEERP